MPGLARSQVLFLSGIEWDAAWQRHQIFASQFAAAGHEVFFVENSGFRNPGLRDLSRVWNRMRRLFLPRAGRRPAPRGLHIVTPMMLPPTWESFRRLNAFLLVPRLMEQLRERGLDSGPVVIAYLPTKTTLEILRHLAPVLTVYDCVDNYYGLPSPPADLAEIEQELMDRSDLVLTTSRTLYADKARRHARVRELHHGTSPDFFIEPPDTGACRRLCYYGTLWHALDYEPIRTLAEAGLDVTLIGPQKEPPPPLPAGVTLRPAMDHRLLPRTLAGYDVLLLPYVDDEYNRGVIPSKIYECLATGRPVVASPLPALEPLREVLYTARTPREWVEVVRSLPRTESAEKREARIRLAREHTHGRSFAQLQEEFQAARPLRPRPAAAASTIDRSRLAFWQGFTWIGMLYGLAKVSTMLTQVAAGRVLGPVHYGMANLIIAVAAFLQILPMMGFQWALSKLPSDAPSRPAQNRLISTALTMFGAWSALCLAFLFLFRGPLSRAVAVEPSLFNDAIAFAFCTAVYVVVSSPLLGLQRFSQRGLAEAIYGFSAPFFLFVFIWQGTRTYHALIMALCLSLLLAAVYSSWSLRRYLRPAWDAASFRLISGFALVAALNLLTAACVLAPGRLILNHWFSPHEVGLFSAYFAASVQISLALLYLLVSVLVPLASAPEGQAEAWRTLRRAGLPLVAASAPAFFMVAAAGLLLFGRQYPIDWIWIAPFAVAAALVLAHGIAGALFMARDFAGLRTSVTGNLLAGLGNVVLGLVLIPRWGIPGAGLALAGGYLMGTAYYLLNMPGLEAEKTK